MIAPENGAKALLGVRKTEMVDENGLKPREFHWESHYLKACNSLPYLAASCSELSLPALLCETSQCGLVRAEFRRMTGPFGVLFKPTTAVVGFLAAGALEHEAPQTIGTPYAMLQFAPEIGAYDFRHAVEKGRMIIGSLNQFKHFILRLFEVEIMKLLFHTSFLALTWIKELQMKLTYRRRLNIEAWASSPCALARASQAR
jgi:hypothetical protein